MFDLFIEIMVFFEVQKIKRHRKLAIAKAIELNKKAENAIICYTDDYKMLLKHVALLFWRQEKDAELHLYRIHRICELKYTKPEPVLFYAMVREELLKLWL